MFESQRPPPARHMLRFCTMPQTGRRLFLGAVCALLGVEPLPDSSELERRAAYAVDCFLAIHACQAPQARAAAG